MRIACIGNMNNIIAPAAQYLSDMGHQVDLFLLYEFDHFKPEADYIDASTIKFNIKRLEMDFGGVMEIPISTLNSTFTGYDFYIGTDYAPAILARIGKRLDVFAWAGTDLFDWPFYRSNHNVPHLWEGNKILTAKYQLEGIRNALCLPMSLNNDFILNILNKIKFKNRIIEPLPFIYYPNLDNIENLKIDIVDQINKYKSEGKLIFFQQSRQWWKTAPANISKGNDIFFKGLALFKKQNPTTGFHIYLCEYGADVEESKQLIKELGLQAEVTWLPIMLRKELLAVLNNADIGVGQFGVESWYLYCSNAEILAACGVYLGYRNDDWYKKNGCHLYPMLNANSPSEINEVLTEFIQSENSNQIRENAKKWLREYNESRFLENINVELRKAENRNNKLSFDSKLALQFTNIQVSVYKILNYINLHLFNKIFSISFIKNSNLV